MSVTFKGWNDGIDGMNWVGGGPQVNISFSPNHRNFQIFFMQAHHLAETPFKNTSIGMFSKIIS